MTRQEKESRKKASRARRVVQNLILSSVAGFAIAIPHVVQADVPAVTDFGRDTAMPVASGSSGFQQAMFVTYYKNGGNQVVLQDVQGDAIVSFAGEHGAWQLDHGLMWFMQMPVYVRHVDANTSANPLC